MGLKSFGIMPSRMSKNILKYKIRCSSFIDLCVQKGKLTLHLASVNCKDLECEKKNFVHLLFLVLHACTQYTTSPNYAFGAGSSFGVYKQNFLNGHNKELYKISSPNAKTMR